MKTPSLLILIAAASALPAALAGPARTIDIGEGTTVEVRDGGVHPAHTQWRAAGSRNCN